MRNMKTWKSLVVATLIVSMLTSLLAVPLTALSLDDYDSSTANPSDTENEGDDPTPAPIDPPAGGEENDGGEGGSTAEPTDPPTGGTEGDEGDDPTPAPIDPPPSGEENDGGEGGSTAEPTDPPAGGEENDGGEGGSTVEPTDPPAGGEGNDGGEGQDPQPDDTDEPEHADGLIYTKHETDEEYSVTGYTGSETAVVIPATYKDLPVTGIREGAFADCIGLESITFMSSQIEICDAVEAIPDTATIYGYLGSTAQTYAQKYGKTFVHMGTAGLVYTLNSAGTGYVVTDYTGTDVHVIIPAFYMGLPVVRVANGSLTNGNTGGSGVVPLPPVPLGEGGGTVSTVSTSTPVQTAASGSIQSVTLLSSTVGLDGSKYTIPTGAVIYGYIASTATTYAGRFSRTFVALDGFYFKLNGDCTAYELEAYKGDASELLIPEIYLGLPVTSIGVKAFFNNKTLIEVTIPEGVTSIGAEAFSGCRRMISAPLPSTLISIGAGAFSDCAALTVIDIPTNVTSLASDAFSGCKAVTSITVDTDNQVYHSAGNCLIETKTATLVLGCGNSVIPTDGSVTTIGVGAFSSCMGMTELTLSEHVTVVCERAFENYTDLMALYFLSSDTEIFDDASTISGDTVIYGYVGSTAQAYAEKYGREFVEISLYTLGDIDGVEGVDVDDAIYLLFYTFYPAKYPVNQPCDFNHDGLVDVDDAIYLLFYTFYPAKYPLS